ncbi:MAG: cell wall-binding repeat-containing protein [Actinobacteria bacterium]|nr:cell wall-binding repeat-containing protein [Actinomycetota bacterium]
MTSSIRSNANRWLTAMLAVALVLGLLVGSSQNTAQAIDPGQTDIAYVADGYNFPDALMGATLAGLNTAPMLGVRSPTTGDTVPPETAAELDRLTNNKANKLDTIYVFGGPAAVSDKVVGELNAWTNNVTRIAGDNRFATMTEISQALPTKVKDSDLLDGMDSTDFLGATDKAADSDLLDGMDSAVFLPMWAHVLDDGSIAAQSGGITTTDGGDGDGAIFVVFPNSVWDAPVTANVSRAPAADPGAAGGQIVVTPCGGEDAGDEQGVICSESNTKSTVLVDTTDSAGTPTDRSFFIRVGG